MEADQKVVNDYGITEEGIRSAMTGESVPGADGQNEVLLMSIVFNISCRIVQNTAPDTPMETRMAGDPLKGLNLTTAKKQMR